MPNETYTLTIAIAEGVTFLCVCALIWCVCFYIAPAIMEAHPDIMASVVRR